MNSLSLVFTIGLVFLGCAIEVGNPHKDDGKKSMINISIATIEKEFAKKISLNLAGIRLTKVENGVIVVKSMNLTQESINLVTDEPNKSRILVAKEEIETGSYTAVEFTLSDTDVGTITDLDAVERPLSIKGDDKKWPVYGSFELSMGKPFELVVYMNPMNSFFKDDQAPNEIIFSPKSALAPISVNLSLSGRVTEENSRWVCAYLYLKSPSVNTSPLTVVENLAQPLVNPSVLPPGPPPPEMREKEVLPLPPFEPSIPPPGEEPLAPPFFKERGVFTKDENSKCSNAFAVVPVRDGSYKFSHLLPGFYDLRLFLSDGTYKDIQEKVELAP